MTPSQEKLEAALLVAWDDATTWEHREIVDMLSEFICKNSTMTVISKAERARDEQQHRAMRSKIQALANEL